MKAIWKMGLGALLLCQAVLPASAWAQTPEAGQTVQIELTPGQSVLKVNSEELNVEKPYVANGSTLVPLRVITTAFGAVLSWDSETRTVGLKSGNTSLSLQIGSTTATVNGVQETLEAAPELLNGTTMVPLRFIAEKFGAKVSYDEVTKQITILGTASASAAGNGIDTDLGKTQIGNSYYGWSMKYPAGLIREYQSFQEDLVGFEDADGEFYFSVLAELDATENMSEDALISRLSDETEGRVLKKTYIEEAKQPYALIVTEEDGEVYEYRAYQKADRLYVLSLYVNKAENYNNPVKYSRYKDLLDSFKVSFDGSDRSLKDLSTVKAGYRTYTDETYGYSLRLPAEWLMAKDEDNNIGFLDPKKNKSISVVITSKAEGDKLQPWTDRMLKRYEDMFLPEYRKLEPQRSLTVDGNPAVAVRSKNTFDKKNWNVTENVFLIKGNYKYQIYFNFDKESNVSEMLIQDTLKSFKITRPSSSIGTLRDSEDMDRTQMSVVKNKTYGFQVTLPAHWKQITTADEYALRFGTGYGVLNILAVDDAEVSPQAALSKLKDSIRGQEGVEFREIENKNVTVAGVEAAWSIFEAGNTISVVCTFEKNGVSYIVHSVEPNAVFTESLKKQITDAVLSVQVP
ncbi:copper amine oxidase N-terminal domain-containing protein [Paenibacillus mucilaginosus]|uniref:Copper amine oxidase-like N-terminal domain-containing protein n=2 Tax=Paenibacillus mucilaginosus TaxID=61624 RepID=F8FG70_PAEMK|nr:copper amine oxidase N-terminal domain-containing protein [Paenibacillus mucilaginosus]AEI43890.1 hypothetical protein KNP414_05366 [Paenibacillus mucilaginosus KNP414]